MSLRSKVAIVAAVPVIALVAVTTIAYAAHRDVTERLQSVQHVTEATDMIDQVTQDLVGADAGLRGYLVTGMFQYLGPYNQDIARINDDLSSLEQLVTHDPWQLVQLSEIRPLVERRLEVLTRLHPARPLSANERSSAIRQLEQGTGITAEILGILDTMRTIEAAQLRASQDALLGARRFVFMIDFIGFPAVLLATIALLILFSRRIVVRLARIEENARRLERGTPLLEADDTRDELGNLARTFAHTAMRVIELEGELRHMATIDPLTRLTNRRGFMPVAEHHLRVAEREKSPVALLFIDVDGLKSVNDRLGHSMGDAMLAETAHILRNTFRTSDLPCRVGGDEFCVLLGAGAALDPEGAIARLEQEVALHNAEPDRPYQLSLSHGFAVFHHETPTTIDRLMTEADERMYEHKRAHRDPATVPPDERPTALGAPPDRESCRSSA